ncbi:MAG TPA: ABC transporter ATP-binding protein, partial [Bdellovibrionota bacterium]|nr:ABC transporter ATP-binding protein [Bdellovibrionota bacterium]
MLRPPKRVTEYLKPHWGVLVVILITGAISSSMFPAALKQIKPILDEVLYQKRTDVVPTITLTLLIIFGVGGICGFFYKFFIFRLAEQIMMRVRNQLYEQYSRLSMEFYAQSNTGTMISRATNDVQMLHHGLTRLEPLIKQPLLFVVLLGCAFYADWMLTSITFLLLPIVALIITKIGKGVRKQSTKTQEQFAFLNSVLTETFLGIRVIKAFGLEGVMKRRFRRENSALFRATARSAFLEALSTPVIEFLMVVGAAVIAQFLLHRILTKTPGEITFLVLVLGLLRQPIKSLNQVNVDLQRAWAAAERIFEILDLRPTVIEVAEAKELSPLKKEIRFENVEFQYGDQPVLHGITHAIRKGETVALVGSSGGGKTTLLNLLPRFYDVSTGLISIDGVDIRKAAVKSLRQQIAYVSQDVFLFHDTITHNIAYGNLYKSMEEIIEAARVANAHEFISTLPRGYDTVVGDRGLRLSGGERQRISIARAILKDAPILILDEATSSLDSESEIVVQEALDRLMVGRTTLVVAHRLSTIHRADRILVLEKGKIIEEGTHKELLAKGGAYARFHRLQFGTEPGTAGQPIDLP